jgi:AraC-like DNA-binding protein
MLKRNVATVGPSVVTRILFSQDALTYTADRPSTFLYFGGTTPMGQLLSVAMSGVEDTLTEAGQLQSRDPLNMIAKEMFLRALATDMSSSFDTKSVRLRERARGFVIEHMSDTSLSPEMIASYIGMSRAALFRLFAEDGGVMSFVTSVRLDVARSMLQSAESSRVGEIAYLCGFKSPSHFSASFRKSYGHAPSDLRVPQGN